MSGVRTSRILDGAGGPPQLSPVPCSSTCSGVVEALVLIITKALNVAASPGVKVMQTSRLCPAASVPGVPPETIWKPATFAQSM